MKRDIDRLVAGIAPDPGPGMTTGARELLREITTDAPYPARSVVRTRSRLLRRRFTGPLIAAFAACTVAVSWLLPGVLGNPASALQDSFSDGLLEGPCYTRPEIWRGREVPATVVKPPFVQVQTRQA